MKQVLFFVVGMVCGLYVMLYSQRWFRDLPTPTAEQQAEWIRHEIEGDNSGDCAGCTSFYLQRVLHSRLTLLERNRYNLTARAVVQTQNSSIENYQPRLDTLSVELLIGPNWISKWAAQRPGK
jgi:hypothetical protein